MRDINSSLQTESQETVADDQLLWAAPFLWLVFHYAASAGLQPTGPCAGYEFNTLPGHWAGPCI